MSTIANEELYQVIYCYYTEGGTFVSEVAPFFWEYDIAVRISQRIIESLEAKCQLIGVYVVPVIENESIDDNCLTRVDIDLETLTLDKISPGYVPKGLFYILNYQTKGEVFMFQNTGKLIFDSVEDKTSAKGNPYRIVHIIDPVDYQRLEYFADSALKVNCAPNEECTLVLKASRQGYSTNMTALAVNKK